LGFDQADAEIVAAAWQAQSLRTGKFDTGLWPTHAADFGLLPWPRTPSFAECPRQLGLYVVAPDAQWVGRLAQAGAPTVQLRFKSANASAVEEQITASVDAVQGTSSRLFINDHWQQAIAAGAYGVHLGQEDLDDADLAAIRQSGLRLGISTHGYAEMLRADKLSPSYVAMGAVYPTTLKRMQTPPQGPGRLRMYARLMQNHPLVAIGGIDFERLDQVLASGVGSVAVVRAIVAANDPESEVHRWAVRMASSQNL
jgi:thiamine-phosphate pyrophosphorylase